MPVFTLSVPTIALYYHYVRQSLREALSTQYVRTARAKGLSERGCSGGTRCRTRSCPR